MAPNHRRDIGFKEPLPQMSNANATENAVFSLNGHQQMSGGPSACRPDDVAALPAALSASMPPINGVA